LLQQGDRGAAGDAADAVGAVGHGGPDHLGDALGLLAAAGRAGLHRRRGRVDQGLAVGQLRVVGDDEGAAAEVGLDAARIDQLHRDAERAQPDVELRQPLLQSAARRLFVIQSQACERAAVQLQPPPPPAWPGNPRRRGAPSAGDAQRLGNSGSWLLLSAQVTAAEDSVWIRPLLAR